MPDNSVVEIGFWRLTSAYIFILVLLLMVRARRIGREREIIVSTLRMTFQLVLVGYVLSFVFKNDHPLFTMAILLGMLVFAVYNVFSRVKVPLVPELRRVIAVSLAIGTLASLLFFLYIVIGVQPWYNSRYFVPLAGMIIGNAMTGIALAVNHLVDGINKQWDVIEAALMIGGRPGLVVRDIANSAFDGAILPTINSMVGMGIVFLPGMMTGQILSGVSPVTAIHYQIAIMLGIAGSVSLSVMFLVWQGPKVFFNQRAQLVNIKARQNEIDIS